MPADCFTVQLILNIAWNYFFFARRSPLLGLVEIALLWASIAVTIVVFWGISAGRGPAPHPLYRVGKHRCGAQRFDMVPEQMIKGVSEEPPKIKEMVGKLEKVHGDSSKQY